MSEQWSRVGDTDTSTERWYYQRRTDADGARVILEAHLYADGHNVVATIHAYTESDVHTGDDVDDCTDHGSAPGRELYDAWTSAGQDDAVVWQALSTTDIPEPPPPPIPTDAAVQIETLSAENLRLRTLLAGMTGVQQPGQPDPTPSPGTVTAPAPLPGPLGVSHAV